MSEELLVVDSLTKRFGGLVAVNCVSFKIGDNEIVGLIGPNGAGKTTLFNLITGFLKPDQGKVIFCNKDITGKSPAYISKLGLARTFQIVRPFLNLKVFENVLLAAMFSWKREKNPQDVVEGVLRQLGLEHKADVKATQLTHGELKRLGVAQAIALKPRLLLLDEPFGGLSLKEIEIVSEAIKWLQKSGTSILIVEHRVRELMKLVGRVIALDQGYVIASGKPEEVVNEKRVIEAFLGRGIDFASGRRS
ncbi:hypothetical protein B9Q13_00385 [Candidatus Marsarchaeota G2 archaeon ECH_B_SAG-G16]|jgi:branched-chain amino acid transport system ATP-binding protein|uniref:ABC transporter domain-containing protein n=3 Tax=Candidatus Marsarchaeota group 2 TaxID=2203771 RepID=A0A2R6C4P3_9ARCH|nr:MAG: hypothetical protein B9Q13_00385 [Candidatus Marsarchaeota G2 archaeon ECH_B_SAG-G16]